MLKEQGEKNVEDVRAIFLEARRLLDEREQQIISGFSKSYDKEEIYLGERRMQNRQHLETIDTFEADLAESQQEDDITILNKTKQRAELGDKALASQSKINFNHIF